MKDIGLILFGWVLGLLGTGVSVAIRGAARRARAVTAIRSELHALQETMAGVVVSIRCRRRTFTPEVIQSLLGALRAAGQVAMPKSIHLSLQALAQGGEASIRAYQDQTAKPDRALTLKRYTPPTISARHLFSEECQLRLVKLKHQLNMFNQHVGIADRHFALTFESDISAENHAAAAANMEGAYDRAGATAEYTVQLIRELMEAAPFRKGSSGLSFVGGAGSSAKRWIASQWPNLTLGVIAVALSVQANCMAGQMRDLAHLDRLPELSCYSSVGFAHDTLVVDNTGSPARNFRVESVVFFYALPQTEAGVSRVEFLLAQYYGHHVGKSYPGLQRVAFGGGHPMGNYGLMDSVRWALADTLTRRGMAFNGIEVRRAVRVRYRDVLGKEWEEFYSDGEGVFDVGALERVGSEVWNTARRASDSLKTIGRVVDLDNATKADVLQQVVAACSR